MSIRIRSTAKGIQDLQFLKKLSLNAVFKEIVTLRRWKVTLNDLVLSIEFIM